MIKLRKEILMELRLKNNLIAAQKFHDKRRKRKGKFNKEKVKAELERAKILKKFDTTYYTIEEVGTGQKKGKFFVLEYEPDKMFPYGSWLTGKFIRKQKHWVRRK